MFPGQRIDAIKKMLKEQKSIDIVTLCDTLQVSDVTVRKYLDKLEKEGFLTKMHGGAMLADNMEDEADNDSTIEEQDEKEQIADLAVTIIEDNDSIFLGPGTTCYLLSKRLKNIKNLTVVTNNVNALEELAPYVKNLYFIGGEIVYDNGIMYSHGPKALAHLEGMFVKKAFITVTGIDFKAGLTMNQTLLLEIIKKINSISKKVIILADYSKFDRIGLHQIAAIDEYDCYVSNEKLDNKYKEYFFDKNIKILTSYDI